MKKDLIEFMKSQAEMSIEIMKLVTMSKQSIIKLENKKESPQEQADYDELIAILDKKEPQLKQLDQSVFDGLDEKWRFAAVDGCTGRAYVYEQKPHFFHGKDYWHIHEGLQHIIGHNYGTSNWQNSLIERDIAKELLEVDLSSELTGSDLCRKMLERGDKYVMCIVSKYKDRIDLDSVILPKTVTRFNNNSFVVTDGKWRYAIPINNQGEPLTAADVGL